MFYEGVPRYPAHYCPGCQGASVPHAQRLQDSSPRADKSTPNEMSLSRLTRANGSGNIQATARWSQTQRRTHAIHRFQRSQRGRSARRSCYSCSDSDTPSRVTKYAAAVEKLFHRGRFHRQGRPDSCTASRWRRWAHRIRLLGLRQEGKGLREDDWRCVRRRLPQRHRRPELEHLAIATEVIGAPANIKAAELGRGVAPTQRFSAAIASWPTTPTSACQELGGVHDRCGRTRQGSQGCAEGPRKGKTIAICLHLPRARATSSTSPATT